MLMALLYRPEVDPSRIYYGTDTRATGLLVGAALAFVWAPWRAALVRRRGVRPTARASGYGASSSAAGYGAAGAG